MNKPKVTIITITFNLIKQGRERTFRQCMESVKHQNYPNIEHLIIDGASNDGSLSLIKEYEEKGYCKCYSEPDTGIYNAMNKGIDRANGDYILFLNSDDYMHNPNGITKSVETIEREKADFTYSDCTYITMSNDLYCILKPCIGNFFLRMPASHQTMLFRKSSFLKINKFDDNFKSAGDFDSVIRFILSGAKASYVPCNFITYRLGGLSDDNQEQSIRESAYAFAKNYNQFEEHSEDEYRKYFLEMEFSKTLVEKLKGKVHPEIQKEMDVVINKGSKLIDENTYKVSKTTEYKRPNLIDRFNFYIAKNGMKIQRHFSK